MALNLDICSEHKHPLVKIVINCIVFLAPTRLVAKHGDSGCLCQYRLTVPTEHTASERMEANSSPQENVLAYYRAFWSKSYRIVSEHSTYSTKIYFYMHANTFDFAPIFQFKFTLISLILNRNLLKIHVSKHLSRWLNNLMIMQVCFGPVTIKRHLDCCKSVAIDCLCFFKSAIELELD